MSDWYSDHHDYPVSTDYRIAYKHTASGFCFPVNVTALDPSEAQTQALLFLRQHYGGDPSEYELTELTEDHWRQIYGRRARNMQVIRPKA